jgi:hypothetical protein
MCLGNGGVPVRADQPGTPLPSTVAWEYRESIKLGFLPPRYYARFGYATLDFRGDQIAVRVVGEDGNTKWPQGDAVADAIIRKKAAQPQDHSATP